MASDSKNRVLSGMRPTGQLHLGHYHGVLKNWVRLQHEYDCYFFVADWHALTTHYEDPQIIADSVMDMVIDWLAAGVNPANAKLFIQSDVPQHAELHLLLSMIVPVPCPATRTSRRSCASATWPPTVFSATRCCRAPIFSSTRPFFCAF